MGTIKPTETGNAHIPELIRKEIESKQIPYIVNAHTAILYNPDVTVEEILESLDILRRDILLRAGMLRKNQENEPKPVTGSKLEDQK